MADKTHTITWISLIFIILTFLFFLASVFILEFAVTVDKDGDILIPWYYWFFFAGAGVFLVVFVILQAIPVPYHDKVSVVASTEKNAPIEKYTSVDRNTSFDRNNYTYQRNGDLYSLMK